MVVTKGGYWDVMVVLLPGATSRIIQGHRVRYFGEGSQILTYQKRENNVF